MSSFVDSAAVVAVGVVVVVVTRIQSDAVPVSRDSRPRCCDRQVVGISALLLG